MSSKPQTGWIVCISDNEISNEGNFVVICKKDTASPLIRYQEKSRGVGVLCRMRGLALVSDIDLGLKLIQSALSEYCSFPLYDDCMFSVPNQLVINKAFRQMVDTINSLGKVDQTLSAIICKPHKPIKR